VKKIINDPNHFVSEVLEGLVLAHPSHFKQAGVEGRVVIWPSAPVEGKVGIVTGGGSGHLPLFTGYIGAGLLDACAIGNVFASAGSATIADAIRSVDAGRGVLCLLGNYGGDVMNFEIAVETTAMDEIITATVIVADDVASAGKTERHKRRGVAGLVYCFKIAGAKAATMADLEAVAAVARKTADACRTVGVALSPCIVPAAGKPTFTIGDKDMEIGMGIHGEPGVRRGLLRTADQIAGEIFDIILEDQPLARGDRVSVLCNSLGATPLEELYIVYRFVAARLRDLGVSIVAPLVGRYASSREMSGLSITVCKLDGELEHLLLASCDSPFLKV
jgi:phosphoenolpyruvate---glycerone phosphotransferase subunit DhaK